MSIAIVEGGRLRYARGFGVRDRALDMPATARTRYGIGSLTKQLVAAATLQLVQRRELSLDEPIGRFFGPGPAAHVSIRDLLDQRSGIPDYNQPGALVQELPWLVSGASSQRELAREIVARALTFRPGTRFAYSNSNYVLLGVILRRVTGVSPARLLRKNIFAPLGMTASALADARACDGDTSCAYSKTPFGVRAVTPWSVGLTSTAGGVVSDVLDLARWDIGLMDGRVLETPMFRAMIDPIGRGGYAFGEYAYRDTAGDTIVWHDGTVYGYKAMNILIPRRRDAIVVLCNADYAHAQIIAMQIDRAMFGVPGGGHEPRDLALPGYTYPIALVSLVVPVALAFLRRKRYGRALILSFCAYLGGVYLWFLAPAFAALAIALQFYP